MNSYIGRAYKQVKPLVRMPMIWLGVLLLAAGCQVDRAGPAPVASSSPAARLPGAPTQPFFPVTGSIQIEDGRCCLGGAAGESLPAQVVFSADSPHGAVTQMRVRPGVCASETEIQAAAWEPFTATKTYSITVALNWTGFYLSVQYQDEQGNLSLVYCDDISIEGSPAAPLAVPTEWYAQIRCISEQDLQPAPGSTVSGPTVTFSWPDQNDLPEGVFYALATYHAGDQFAALVASGQTREPPLTLTFSPDKAGEIVWTLTVVDALGTPLDHGRCGSYLSSLLTVEPATGIKGSSFWYQP